MYRLTNQKEPADLSNTEMKTCVYDIDLDLGIKNMSYPDAV